MSRRRGRDQAVDLTVALGPLSLPNPVITASGTYGHGDEVARYGPVHELGAVTAKSVSAEPWPGNPPPRLHATAAGMVNAVGLQGPGVRAWIEDDLPSLRRAGARVIASIWGTTVEAYRVAAERLGPGVPDLIALELNVSCPNLEAGSQMFASDAVATAAVVGVVHGAGLGLPIFTKLSPAVSDLVPIARAAIAAGSTGLTLINTMPSLVVDAEARRPALGNGGGGLSGPAIKPVALRAVWDVSRALPDVPIIGTGGITRGLDAVEMLLAGACGTGVGTATFLDPRAPFRVLDELATWCTRHDVARARDLVGGLAPAGAAMDEPGEPGMPGATGEQETQ